MTKDLNRFHLTKPMFLGATMLLASVGMASAAPSASGHNSVEPSVIVASSQQAKHKVTGIVEDELGPITGANVVEKGTTNGTITDGEGKFSLEISPNSTLVVSFIGYVEQQIPVNNQKEFHIKLNEDSQALEEVVVVGYGTQKKANLTGAVASVNFADQAMSRPITNVSSALAGLSAGVQVMQNSGQPGSDGATIRVRGVGTLNNSDPLVIVDGMESVMDAVNPQDIENISVLKDAASSAIYGSRAANGVILITTKRGKAGKLSINYTGRVSYAQPTNLVDMVSNYADYMEWLNEAAVNVGQKANFSKSTIDLWREKAQNPNELNANGVPNYVAFPNTDWQSALFNHGFVNDHNVSLSGGSDKIRFLTSAGYLGNPGLVENTGIQRYSLRANIEADVTKWLTVGTRTFVSMEDKDPGNFDNANNFLRQTTPGLYPKWNGQYGYPEAPEESATANSIFAFLNGVDGTKKKSRFNTTLYSKVTFLKGLTWDFNLNYKRRWDEERSWTNAVEKIRFSDGVVMSPATQPDQMSTSFYTYANYDYTLENLLRYNTTIAKDHDISALLGYQEYYYYEYSNSGSKKGLIDQSVNVPGAATEMVSIGGGAVDRSSRSFFGRINYAYKSKYLFEANLRHDGHSRYHRDHRWGTFPSFSGAWRISEEAFMANSRTWLDNLKLRVSYGELGNTGGDQVGDYEYQSIYNITRYSFNNLLVSGLASTSIANSLLSWESTAVTNVGIDASMLNNRLTFETDIFYKNTTGILYRPSIYMTMGGMSAPRMNLAGMDNKGIELTLGWKDKVGKVNYSVSGNFSYIANKVSEYKGKYEAYWDESSGERVWINNIGKVGSDTGTSPVVEGQMKNEYYMFSPYKGSGKGYETDGINGGPKDGMIRTEQDMEWAKAMIAAGHKFKPNEKIGKDKIWYGDYLFADNNGDGIYGGEDDKKFQGCSNTPKFNFGLQMAAMWNGFDISMNWAGAAGFKLYWGATTGYNSPTARVGVGLGTDIATNHYFYDPENPTDPRTKLDAKYGRLVMSESGFQNTTASTLYLYNANYLKLKNLTIGYTLPSAVLKKISAQNIRFYLSGENLFSIDKYPGQDPELGAYPEYTSLRQFAFGVNVSF